MSNERKPLVSIVIPVYNGSNYMREAIDSAIAQTYENIEIIVVNDGSKDGGKTEEIALSYGDKIQYIHKENGGVSSALNAGIKAMKGEYFSWLSHDDKYLPEKIASQVDVLTKVKDKRVIGICNAKQIDKDSLDLQSNKKKGQGIYKFDCGKIISWEKALQLVIRQGSFGGCNLLIPKIAFEECGLFNEELRYCQDFLMWMTFFLKGWGLVRTPGIHVCNRVHGGQLTITGRDIFKKDSLTMGDILLDSFLEKSTHTYNYVKDFAIYNAKYNNTAVVERYILRGRQQHILSATDSFNILLVRIYGGIRPTLRKLYYTHIRKAKI